MGLGPSKEKINKILKMSREYPNYDEQKNIRIEFKYTQSEKEEKKSEYFDNNDYSEEIKIIKSPAIDIKNTKKFPYNSVGILKVKFPISDEDFLYTCFMIGTNIVVTLASNLVDNNKGGKAKSIITTFKNEEVKWKNIYIQDELKIRNTEKKNEDLNNNNSQSKLAVILYEDNINNEWMGILEGKKEDFNKKELIALFGTGLKKTLNDVSSNEAYLKEMNVTNGNPFINSSEENKEIINRCPGSPIYYKDDNSGRYVIAIINESLEFQYFDHDTMVFLCDMLNEGKLLRKEQHKGIDEDNIIKLDLSKQGLVEFDIKYFIEFKLKNLRILNLSSNSIRPEGAYYLVQGEFKNLRSLNLNFNEIEDKGLMHISNGFFPSLNYLYLFHNNISPEGIKYLIKAQFINNLIILSLSENIKIGDVGIKILTEHKGWNELNTLYLENTGLTDIALKYLVEASMPKLTKLNIEDNNFTEIGKPNINILKMNYNKVYYLTEAERKKEKKVKKDEEGNKIK